MSEESPPEPTAADVDNSAGKSAQRGVPFQPGFDPRRGHGPEKGSGGRPTNEFRESLREMIEDPAVKEAAKTILTDPKNRQFAALWKAVVAQAHGNPTQPIELESGSLPIFKVEVE